jgi:hypothetical protein
MSRRTRTTAILLSSAALIGAGVPAGAQAHNDHKRGSHQHAKHVKHGHHNDRGLARTARALGVSKQELRSALKAVAAERRAAAKPPSFKALFAQQLGVTVEQVKAAQREARKAGRHGYFDAFAAALGTDKAGLKAAFDAARDAQKAQWRAKRDKFVTALAQKLGVSEDRVREAFDRHCGFRHH